MSMRIKRVFAVAGIWTLIGLFFAAQEHTMYPALFQRSIGWGHALAVNLNHYYGWALFTPAVLWLVERVPWRKWPLALGLHLASGLVIATAQLALTSFLRHLWIEPDGRSLTALLAYTFRLNFHGNLVTYACIVGAALAWESARRAKQRELQTSQLETMLAQAQLQSLKMQLHPHFLFNALNGISALIPSDPAIADEMLARLGSLLRFSLERAATPETTLREELDFIAQYLELERLQYADRMKVFVDVPDALMDARVPTLILQPLVENALRHGIAPKAEGGRLRVQAEARGPSLRIEILDDGYGPKPGFTERIGLSNVRQRLHHLYGADGLFELKLRESGGASASITLPLSRGSS